MALAENDEPVALADDITPLPPVAPAKPVAEAREAEPMKSLQPKAPELATPGAAAALLEVSGTAVELLPDGAVLVLEGKTNFRLYRAWLLATTKFAGGGSRTTYLRLQRMDGASVEQRYGPGRTRRGPHSVLSFHAGELHVALRFEGLDKPYRAFAEKVLLQSHVPSKNATSPGQ